MSHQTITTKGELEALCQRLADADRIGFDTEFVSEDSYRPQLCLIQIATPTELAVIDTIQLKDVRPFWKQLACGSQQTIVHAGREELNFSLTSVESRPARLFDTQIAAGFVTNEYPAGYAALISKILGHKPAKGETRTDWRRRPLSDAQIEYALEDVRYLMPLCDRLSEMLAAHGRTEWLEAEMSVWQDEVEAARTRQRWRRVSGVAGLSQRSQAVVRELWRWREQEAERRDMPPRRVLRDDLLVEIAKRKTADPQRIRAVRGMERSGLRKSIPELAECVHRALEAPEADFPRRVRRDLPPQLNLLGQFLTPALSSICRSAQLATSLVGTASDVRELIAYQLEFDVPDTSRPPALAVGWRAQVVGKLIDELLSGKKSIRIDDPNSDHPLAFDDVPDNALPG